MAPAQLVYTNGTGDGLASTAANWTDQLGGPSVVPGTGDYVILRAASTGVPGSNTALQMDITTWAVDRVLMESSYTATFTIGAGNAMTTTNQFVQYGTLTLAGTSSVGAGTSMYINGTVTNTPGSVTTGSLAASGSFVLASGGTITATGSAGSGMAIGSAGFDHGGTINVGTTTASGLLTITGPITQLAAAVTNVFAGSALGFLQGGSSSDPTIEGTLNLIADSTSGATLSTQGTLAIDGGTLNSSGGSTNVIVGDVGVYNEGYMEVDNTLAMTTGSLTIGGLTPSGPSTAGTLNLDLGGFLTFPVDGSTTDTVVVTDDGEVNMAGASIVLSARISSLDVAGTLNSYGGTGSQGPVFDAISGDVTNSGTMNLYANLVVGDLAVSGQLKMYGANLYAGLVVISSGGTLSTYGSSTAGDGITSTGGFSNSGILEFLGGVHTLALSGNYSQGSGGTLKMRLANNQASDLLTVSGGAALAGTLYLSGMGSLNDNQTWTIMTTGGAITNNFTSFHWPDTLDPDWAALPGANVYAVTNTAP